MGWFTKSKVKKPTKSSKGSKASKPHKPSITDPPNVYGPPRPVPPAQQPRPQNPPGRPATTAPSQQLLPPPAAPYAHGHASQSQPHFQPAGYLPPPPNWNPAPGYPVIVNQHYYLGGPQPPHYQSQQNLQHYHSPLGKFTGSMVNLAKVASIQQLYDDGLSAWHGATQLANSTNGLYNQVFSRFNNVMTLIDHEKLCGNENDLFNCHSASYPSPQSSPENSPPLPQKGFEKSAKPNKRTRHKDKPQSCNVTAAVISGNYFSKVELYANSKLPMDLPPLDLYFPRWRLLNLAAEYSQRVYEKPRGAELDAHVSSDWRSGTKAMCIKSMPMDHMDTIVFAIRGTASFMDWAVNLNTAPVSPLGFLDDPGNYCHAGFLSVAKKMIKPVAARLMQLLREDPVRSTYSLMITGHSAGGAVAALLYSHMLAETKEAQSDLNIMTTRFKRIHCVTFGAPPVSLLPLEKPDRPKLRKSLFLSFVNEGDPVVRADKAYVKSLVELLSSPPPSTPSKGKDPKSKRKPSGKRSRSPSRAPKPEWKVPPATLSNAGRLVVLRSGDPKAKPKDRKTLRERLDEGVKAATCADEQLRGVIWGDPMCHLMSLYAGRIEALSFESMTGRPR
ncbi:hypothetical protein FDECE_2009 [Fusarium decemcellulare]|nr:hypothetical protein FDECE_2009 [Fusarium decemcellulare]